MAHDSLGVSITHDPKPQIFAFDPPMLEPRTASASSESTYVMVQSTGPVDSRECEEESLEAIEVTVMWGTSVLEVFHLFPPRPFLVGSGEGAEVDFLLPPELAPYPKTAIVEVEHAVARVVVPQGAALSLRSSGHPAALAAPERELRAGRVYDLSFGALIFRLSSVARGKRVPRALAGDYRGIGASLLASFGATAAFLGVLAYYTPALGALLDGDLDRDQAARLRPYLTALAEREEKRKEEQGAANSESGGGTPGKAADGREGAMGRPNAKPTQKRTAIAGTGERILSREQAIADAKTFGLAGMLATLNSRALPTALWGRDVANGPDAVDAWGNLYGVDIGESAGAGGLGVSGAGSGGGERGEWFGIGTGGACNPHCGLGIGGEGFGKSLGRGGGGRVSKGPQIRMATGHSVSGHLAPELIQRVVRQNFGRFRNCYEMGLRTNPNLTGRVTTRFIIDREGSVSTASNGGSDLPDSKVVSCVVSAFYGVTFPAPQTGVVSVAYPIMFTPG
jgi:hypothetical protein